jgi:AcrR family transcriptional regulator
MVAAMIIESTDKGNSRSMAQRKEALSPRKTPQQSRSRHLCDALKEATARILKRQNSESFSTNDVADLAGVSIGSLYQYYPSKEVLIAELIRDMRRQMLADIRCAIAQSAGCELGEELSLLIRAAIQHHKNDPVLALALEQAEKRLPLDNETEALNTEIHALLRNELAKFELDNPDQTARGIIGLCRGLFDASAPQDTKSFESLEYRLNLAVSGFVAGLSQGNR